jgi:hypothetical protein
MSRSQFFYGPGTDLSREQIEALSQIKAGKTVPDPARRALEMADLVKKGLGGWVLTQAGEFRLAADRWAIFMSHGARN